MKLPYAEPYRIKMVEPIRQSTKEEREKPEIIGKSRKERIAKGSGVDMNELNKLLKQFKELKKMMKQFTGGSKGKKGKRSQMENMLKGMNLPF